MELKWVSNYHPADSGPERKREAAKYIVGEPKGTPKFTAEKLKQMGWVGLYERVG